MENLDFKASGQAAVNAVEGNNTRVSGFAKDDRKFLGQDDKPMVALEWWSRLDEEDARLLGYSVVKFDPAYARRVAQQLNAMADYADGLTDRAEGV